jgi:hypothetical protein
VKSDRRASDRHPRACPAQRGGLSGDPGIRLWTLFKVEMDSGQVHAGMTNIQTHAGMTVRRIDAVFYCGIVISAHIA